MSDPEAPVALTAVATEVEAGAIVTALGAYGIYAQTTGGFTAGFRAEAPGVVRIWVRQQDLEQARAALGEIEAGADSIDWEHIDVGQPEEPT